MISSIEESAFFAKKYLEDLLSFFGLRVDVGVQVEGESILLDVPSTHLNGFLIGNSSGNLQAMNLLVSTAVKQHGNRECRVYIDIAGYKKQKDERLTKMAQSWMKQVKQSGQEMSLEPMNAAERRLIHRLASDHGLTTESTGEGSQRHVVLKSKSEQNEEQG